MTPPPALPSCATCYFWRMRPKDGRIVCHNADSYHHGETRGAGDGCRKWEATPNRRKE